MIGILGGIPVMVKTLASRFRNVRAELSKSNTRSAPLPQGFLDAYGAAVLTKGYLKAKAMTPPGAPLTAEHIHSFYEEVDDLTEYDMNSFLQEQLTQQMIGLLEAVHTTCQEMMEMSDLNRFENEVKVFSHPMGKNKLLEKLGYRVVVKPSSVVNAGMGLFVETADPNIAVPAGTIMALFPGVVHLQEFVNLKYAHEVLLPDPEFMLMTRFDGHVIDSRKLEGVPFNPYGAAHMTNHVPPNERPNVLQFAYNLPADFIIKKMFPPHLRRYVPNVYAKKPTLSTYDRSIAMPMMVLLASSPLKHGDELFMDYRLKVELDPNSKPSWYTPFDAKAYKAYLEQLQLKQEQV